MPRLFRSPDARALLFLIAFPLVYFWQITLGLQVWYANDTMRLFHPFGVELARALNEGRLPLWTPYALAGFPLFAEGQVAALYPLNLLLYKFLPAHYALSYSTLIHLAFAGAGMYLCARSYAFAPTAALLAGIIFSFGGFALSQLNHPTIIAASAWLPWIILFQNKMLAANETRARWFLLAAFSIGVMYLAGSVQIAFLNSVAFIIFGAFNEWENIAPADSLPAGKAERIKVRVINFLRATMLPLALGIGSAAMQLIPTAELIGYSVRGGGLGENFLASYSLPLHFLAQFLAPYTLDYPGEDTNEYWGFIGVAAFMLCAAAPFLKRNRRAIFFAALALVALSLALGPLNPLNQILFRLPGFSFFRVPARYLLLATFAGALLAACALDVLTRRAPESRDQRAAFGVALCAALGVSAMMWLATFQKLQFWLDLWKFLPVGAAIAALALIWLALKQKISRAMLSAAFIGLTLIELTAFAPPFFTEYIWMNTPAYVTTPPRALAAYASVEPARVVTDLSDFPAIPALRGSLFTNLALVYGKEGAQIYSSLALARNENYVSDLSPAMLNLLNARYFAVPLDPRPLTKSSAPYEHLALDILATPAALKPLRARKIQITSFLEQSAQLADGALAGEIILRYADGATRALPLRVGVETAAWDYDRARAMEGVAHSRPPSARVVPAFWRALGRAFDGYVYRADIELDGKEIVAVSARSNLPATRLVVENIFLLDESGNAQSLATLTTKNNFTLAYLSDTVAVWRNEDALPRAFIAHSTEVVSDDAAFARLRSHGFQPERVVLLTEGQPRAGTNDPTRSSARITRYSAERVEIAVSTDRAGYLVLADSFYPGWIARVDGVETPIVRADVIFRAVPVDAGDHAIIFEYQPASLVIGAWVSAASVAFIVLFIFWMRKKK